MLTGKLEPFFKKIQQLVGTAEKAETEKREGIGEIEGDLKFQKAVFFAVQELVIELLEKNQITASNLIVKLNQQPKTQKSKLWAKFVINNLEKLKKEDKTGENSLLNEALFNNGGVPKTLDNLIPVTDNQYLELAFNLLHFYESDPAVKAIAQGDFQSLKIFLDASNVLLTDPESEKLELAITVRYVYTFLKEEIKLQLKQTVHKN